ncbi:ubiquitin recognition factor in ER-associated degradation protein 1 [Trichonephila inaurata madagascariensis]|uniref:Ubiquitin fusion degradation protein 1 homolog n=1 Tax=Trichonephila inaurata madagascariensis TaxID=2747483 RepID=A0A8X6YGY2_9ARAC|nr:ubiquitin recognition factor in ER-associated degradation protein 1 [Trichonephila inaurata madagascariensis]
MFSFNVFHEPVRPFNTQYRCYSVSMLPGNERRDVEKGGKIIMPPSSLDHLARLNIVYPMLFKLTNKKTNRCTHCGVLEFVADEGKVYLPYWMMRNLLLEEGGMLHIENATLPVATFSKFQPQSEDFLDITNPKAVLENALRNFACLTTGDLIAIEYNDKIYEFLVLETKPQKAVSIIECDMNVEFDAPVGYKEPEHRPATEEESQPAFTDIELPPPDSFIAFRGKGNRLDGKTKGTELPVAALNVPPPRRGIPDYDYEIGTLRFIRTTKIEEINNGKPSEDSFAAFSGKGWTLRQKGGN